MPKLLPSRIVTDMINSAFESVKLPESNNARSQRELSDFYLASVMASLGKSTRDKIIKHLKELHTETLARVEPNTTVVLEEVAPFTLVGKMSNPRSTFDKSEFIRKVADKYELSAIDLHDLADECVSEGSASISFEVTYNGE